jgi:hypothetical protein
MLATHEGKSRASQETCGPQEILNYSRSRPAGQGGPAGFRRSVLKIPQRRLAGFDETFPSYFLSGDTEAAETSTVEREALVLRFI